MILYEYPFNERIRTYLRLEHLFGRLAQLMPRDSAMDHHFALITVFEVMDVASRADLKSDVLKDLERHKLQMTAFRGNPAISEASLDAVLGQLSEAFEQLSRQHGKPGSPLLDNEFLMTVRSRAVIPAGTCAFDLPAYYHWQHCLPEQRRSDLDQWAQTLVPLARAVALLLQICRDFGKPQKVMALKGHFQQTLSQGRTFQLMRLHIDAALDLVPEISGNRLMASVRLMRLDDGGKLHAVHDDVPLEISLCV
ncbi:cell division protein ZapD [Ottowia sp.]|uniref:cell division protein ZapD n=1 Tax=Ottowia sp. TaxID=1898956 RepID=UPI003A89C783